MCGLCWPPSNVSERMGRVDPLYEGGLNYMGLRRRDLSACERVCERKARKACRVSHLKVVEANQGFHLHCSGTRRRVRRAT